MVGCHLKMRVEWAQGMVNVGGVLIVKAHPAVKGEEYIPSIVGERKLLRPSDSRMQP